MRTFIAVEIGDEARATLGRYLADLYSRFPPDSWGIKWSKAENIHVTLRFLGEVPDQDLPAVATAARTAAANVRPFSLELGEPATFGGRAPRVLILSVGGETVALAAVHAALDDHLDRSGFGREGRRRYTPHLTLGRRRKGPVPAEWRHVSFAGKRDWEVEEIVVFSSTLTPNGPIYTQLATCPLNAEEEQAQGPS